MNGANHKMSGFSTYPFYTFGNGWEKGMPQPGDLPYKGDTVVGNDVWLGYKAVVMPGVKTGDGAVVASQSVVVKNVPAYSVVGGNPAGLIRMRFSEETVRHLLEIAWWNWNAEKISRNLDAIMAADIDALNHCE